MIWLYSGTPGSGKSYHLAKDVYSRLRSGKRVISNVTFNLGYIQKRNKFNFKYVDNSELTVSMLEEYAGKYHEQGREGQTLLVIDECAVKFNSREYQSKDRMEWLTFFSQHRKLGYNVILVAQNDRMIDRQIRAVVEYEVKHRKISNFNIFGLLLSLLFGGTLFIGVTYWYGVKEITERNFFAYRPRIGKFYNTFQLIKKDRPAPFGERAVSAQGPRSATAEKESL